MLTLRQMDSIVRNNLLIIAGIKAQRRAQGTNIFYDVSYRRNTAKEIYIGTYRVWESTDGDARANWMPLETSDPEIENLRKRIWDVMVVDASRANQNKKAIKHPIEPPKPPEPKGSGGNIIAWLKWHDEMKKNGLKCTLKEVADKSGYSYGYIKQKSMEYKAQPNLNT